MSRIGRYANMGDLVVTENQMPATRPKHAGGRPTLYSRELTEAICQRIRKGVRPEAAAVAQGLNPATYYRWMEQEREFRECVLRADAEAEGTYTEALLAHATSDVPGDGKLCVEWLKRRRRADYGDTLDIRRVDTAQLLQLLSVASGAIEDVSEPALLTEEDVR